MINTDDNEVVVSANDEDRIDDFSKVTLEEIDSYVVKDESVQYFYNFKSVIDGNKYILSCTETEDVNSQVYEFVYEYKDEALQGNIGREYALEEYIFFSILVRSVALAEGYSSSEAKKGLGFFGM